MRGGRPGVAPGLWGLGVSLVLVRLPFLWTGHLQEDAFIAFRTAFNLADHGVLGFNVGEHYAAATSLIYAYFCAAMRVLAGDRAVVCILICNALIAAFAIVRASRVWSLAGWSALVFALWVGSSSGALLPAFNGMVPRVRGVARGALRRDGDSPLGFLRAAGDRPTAAARRRSAIGRRLAAARRRWRGRSTAARVGGARALRRALPARAV